MASSVGPLDATAETDPVENPTGFVKYWMAQLDSYNDEYKNWESRCDKIVRRYRDERNTDMDGNYKGSNRFNSLWSNVQTLQPAVYLKPPKPNVERRYLDKDPLARFSSMTLERSLEVQIEQGYLHESMQKAVLDYLLVGRGVLWERYEPTYGEPEDLGPTPQDDEGTEGQEGIQENEAPRPVTYEKVCTDYVYWKNFRHDPKPCWDEVTWTGKREYLTRPELRKRFKGVDPESGRLIADLIPLSGKATRPRDANGQYTKFENYKKNSAAVWEIWDKTSRRVIFIAPDWQLMPLEVTDDPLGLQTFWPCPKPLYATLTNESLVPVPDYIEYQDQAQELDNLTGRIKALTDAVRVNGIYDASYPELKRILQEGVDNRMIGVKNYAEFAAKGGLPAAMSFVPLKEIAEALIQLYDAFERTKQNLYEITGISDLMRGQGDASETATAQRIKGQFGTLRLQDRQAEVQRFARDDIRIKAEIISEQFSPEILSEMTGMVQFIKDEIESDQPAPMMGHNDGPPMGQPPSPPPMGAGAPQPGVSPPGGMQPIQPPPEEIALQIFHQSVDLLKNDKMRTFRIDIETDSTIEVDAQAEKESVVELFTAIGGFMEKAMVIGQNMPEIVPALGQSILFAFRKFRVGRDVEGAWQQAIDKLTQQAKNPPPPQPSPDEIKAKAEAESQQQETQREQMRFQMEQQAADQQAARDQQSQQLELQIKEREAQLKEREMAMNLEFKEKELAMKERSMLLDAQIKERSAAIEAEGMDRKAQFDERSHQLNLETAEFKAKQSKKPKNENA